MRTYAALKKEKVHSLTYKCGYLPTEPVGKNLIKSLSRLPIQILVIMDVNLVKDTSKKRK